VPRLPSKPIHFTVAVFIDFVDILITIKLANAALPLAEWQTSGVFKLPKRLAGAQEDV